MKQKTIEIRDLSIGYKTKYHSTIVAEHLHSVIYSGELTCLLGANGVGKSTLLRTLAAFQPKLSGQIHLLGRETDSYTNRELSKIVGVVLTEKWDVRNMSVTELVGMGRSPYTGFWGKLNRRDEAIVSQAISQVHIEDLASRMVHTLSDGERQKAMIAKALAQETPVIFLDEPTAFLDFPSRVEMMQLLHRLTRQANKTIFLSTHDLELALQTADKVWLMDKSKGIKVGVPEDLALDGSLHQFVQGKGIVFDEQTGLFRIINAYSSQIRLTGEGRLYEMVQKALRRNGVLAEREIVSNKHIEACEKITVHTGKEIVTAKSISELLEILET